MNIKQLYLQYSRSENILDWFWPYTLSENKYKQKAILLFGIWEKSSSSKNPTKDIIYLKTFCEFRKTKKNFGVVSYVFPNLHYILHYKFDTDGILRLILCKMTPKLYMFAIVPTKHLC